jgi:pyrroline-5-carboxylate reductase
MSETFAFLGTGSMNGAVLDGLRAADPAAVVRATTRSSNATRPGVESRSTESDPSANRWAVEGATIVVVGVKPFAVSELLSEIADALDPSALIVSVAAGITTHTMEGIVANPVVRSMPNTPALVGKGVTGIAAGSRATPEHMARARALFERVGWVFELPEDRIDALSTISGSGPAYVFHAMEQWTAAARELGFTEDDARNLVEKTFAGATALLEVSDAGPTELRRRVTSPNGTTERAVAVLDDAHLADIYTTAARAALARAAEIARELGS